MDLSCPRLSVSNLPVLIGWPKHAMGKKASGGNPRSGDRMWPMVSFDPPCAGDSHGKKKQNKKRAPAGATEMIDHCKRLCRPLTRAEVLTTAASPWLSPGATIAHVFVGAVREPPLPGPALRLVDRS